MSLAKSVLVVAVVATFLMGNVQAGTIPPIWETNFGSSVLNADDATTVINFGFAFPFLGNSYTSASLSSNGFLWLNSANSAAECCNGNVPGFLAGDPRIAGGWFDLKSTNVGNVDYNTFGDRAVITFVGVPECCSDLGSYTFQMQLLSTGRIIFGYNEFATPGSSHDILIGVTPGNNDPDPGGSDLLNGTPFSSVGGTVYQLIPGISVSTDVNALTSAVLAATFEGSNVIFDPNGRGWNVSNSVTANPEPSTLGMFGLGAAVLLGLARRKRIR